MKIKAKKTQLSYDVEADVLRVELAKHPIDYATEFGNFIVHFSPKNIPVYFEILEARKFLSQTGQVLEKAGIRELAI